LIAFLKWQVMLEIMEMLREREFRAPFDPNLKISFESSHYRVRTISSDLDLAAVMKLRSKCFPLPNPQPDIFDLAADHLIVQDTRTGLVCGAYRVTCSDFSHDFESGHDFRLDQFLQLPDKKIELAWACVDPAYRSQLVISMLWRGLTEIFKQVQPRFVFGLTSIGRHELTSLPDFCKFLEGQYQIDRTLQIQPQKSKAVPFRDLSVVAAQASAISIRKIPSLLRIYLLAGALICAQPAFDPEINVYDFFTVLDLDQPSTNFLEKLTQL
jgi:putative hemolysin